MKKNPSAPRRRRRRGAQQVKRIREHFQTAIDQEGSVTLTDLIARYGSDVGVGNTPSDKNLIKRQLDHLDAEGKIQFRREGRDLVARSMPAAEEPAAPSGDTEEAIPMSFRTAGEEGRRSAGSSDLIVIRAYARQLEEFSRTLQDQISTLVRMVEKAAQ